MFAGMDLCLIVLMYPQRGSFKIYFQKFKILNFKFSVGDRPKFRYSQLNEPKLV
jgi:hypothetical protein